MNYFLLSGTTSFFPERVAVATARLCRGCCCAHAAAPLSRATTGTAARRQHAQRSSDHPRRGVRGAARGSANASAGASYCTAVQAGWDRCKHQRGDCSDARRGRRASTAHGRLIAGCVRAAGARLSATLVLLVLLLMLLLEMMMRRGSPRLDSRRASWETDAAGSVAGGSGGGPRVGGSRRLYARTRTHTHTHTHTTHTPDTRWCRQSRTKRCEKKGCA